MRRGRDRPKKTTERATGESPNDLVQECTTVESTKKVTSSTKGNDIKDPKRSKKATSRLNALPARLIDASKYHNDLQSFLAYASRTNLGPSTNVYKGTHYEYTVASSLARLNFTLHRTGRSNDLGIDLIGYFKLPSPTQKTKRGGHELRVLVQCKAVKPTPSMIRELEGAYVGAPAGWTGEGVLALLVASKEATKGVRDALQRSRWPMGLVQVTGVGEVKQFLWNPVAAQIGLEGLGVTVRYGASGGVGMTPENSESENGQVKKPSNVKSSIALTWMGRLWTPAHPKE